MALSTERMVDAMSRAITPRVIGPILMVASLIGFGLFWLGASQNGQFADAVQTTGTSVAKQHTLLRNSGEDANRSCWLPVIEFEDQDGVTHRFRGSDCDWNAYANPPGTIYDVEYVPGSDPMLAREKSVVGSHILQIVGGGVGAVLLLVGAVLTVVLRKAEFDED